MDFREAGEHDLPAIRRLLAAANDTPWDLERVAQEKCFQPGPQGPPVTIVAEEAGELVGIATSTSHALRLLAVRPDRRREGIGSALFKRSLRTGSGRLSIYGEAGNYFLPGVPESDRATISFFRSLGLDEEAEPAVNLVLSLEGNSRIPNDLPDKVERGSPADRDRITEFAERHFGSAWAWEVSRAFENTPPTLFIVCDEEGRVAGFSAHDANNRGLGFFGPMGVEPGQRGKGTGRALLVASLIDLHRLGYREAVISWAANAGFYEEVAGAARRFSMIRFSATR
ncbi:MAG: GNAT family N-acetyltransferase [Thermoanaerobaculia bacterium]